MCPKEYSRHVLESVGSDELGPMGGTFQPTQGCDPINNQQDGLPMTEE